MVPSAVDPFAPLPEVVNGQVGTSRAGARATKKPAEIWEPKFPAPREPPETGEVRHFSYGVPSARFIYRNKDGDPLFATYRFDLPPAEDGTPQKDVVPYTFGRRAWTTKAGRERDQTAWHFKRPGVPVPLYGLDQLALRPDATVLVAEGEKKADAVSAIFPEMVGIASQGGSNSAGKSDWSPLAGRHVVVWPDCDEAGRHYARDVEQLALEAGAASVKIVAVPEDWPDGWDLADALPEGVLPETLTAMLSDARSSEPEPDAEPEPAAEPDAITPERRAEEIDRLSRLPRLEYAAERKPAAQMLGLNLAALDAAVKAEKAKRRDAAVARERTRPPPVPGEVRWPFGFFMREDGLYADTGEDAPPEWLCAPIQVLGEGRDAGGESWGLWLRWLDRDQRPHTWPMPARMLTVGPGEIEAALMDRGLRLSVEPGARMLLRQALGGVQSGDRVTLVSQTGWHAPAGGDAAFVLPDGETVGRAREHLVLKAQAEHASHAMTQAGTLEEWQHDVARFAVGNPIPAFMIAAAFAGPLLDPVGEPSGGFHFFGRSKTGKTLALRLALSVWGLPKKGGLLRDWRSTANGLEAAAEECSDGLLPLDEIHQADSKEVVGGVYSLANESGKQRLRRDASAQRRRTWRSVVLSTGEVDVAAVAAKAGQTLPAGADVRLPSINVDGGAMWPTLHGVGSASELMGRLQVAVARCYGRPIRAFLDHLANARSDGGADLDQAAALLRAQFISKLPAGSDPQVQDVARRCALVALAGEMAVEWGILPWPKGEATKDAAAVLDLWVGRRGGSGSAEESQHVKIVRAFLLEHGAARFVALRKELESKSWVERHPDRPVVQRAGWRRAGDGDDLSDEYLIAPDAWHELCSKGGADPAEVGKTLLGAGFLERGDGKNLTRTVRVPTVGKLRVYVINPKIFEGRDDNNMGKAA